MDSNLIALHCLKLLSFLTFLNFLNFFLKRRKEHFKNETSVDLTLWTDDLFTFPLGITSVLLPYRWGRKTNFNMEVQKLLVSVQMDKQENYLFLHRVLISFKYMNLKALFVN